MAAALYLAFCSATVFVLLRLLTLLVGVPKTLLFFFGVSNICPVFMGADWRKPESTGTVSGRKLARGSDPARGVPIDLLLRALKLCCF